MLKEKNVNKNIKKKIDCCLWQFPQRNIASKKERKKRKVGGDFKNQIPIYISKKWITIIIYQILNDKELRYEIQKYTCGDTFFFFDSFRFYFY